MINMLEGVLRRPKTVFVLMIALLVAGIFSYINIPKEDSPDIDVPVFYVSISQQGISPEDAERLLIRPMETELRGLDGLKEITAIASEGHAGIVLEFDISFDKDEAMADVRDKVDTAKGELPADAEEPTISETNFALVPTITIALSGNVPERTLYQHARRLKDQVEAIDTVRSADLKGHREELLEVLIDSEKLESYAITQQELLTSLAQNNQLVPAGYIDGGQGRFNVKVPGLVETALDVYSLPIKQSGEGVVTLSDVAEIRRTFKDADSYTRVNGKPAIALDVTKRIGTNIIENNIAIRAVVDEASKDWPETVQVDYMLDMSSNIFEVLGSLQSSIMTAIFLVMILVLAALGLRSALLVGLAIPTSFMVGFLILSGLGYTVNIMVMFGLVLTVGMLVDGAIVMVEYADRKVHEGMEDREAYIRAAKLMFWPIVSSTATTLVAFLPMLLWPGVAGEFMSYLPIMVIIVLTAALLTAMVFLPVTGGIFAVLTHWIERHAAGLLAVMFAVIGAVMALAFSGVLPGSPDFSAQLAAAPFAPVIALATFVVVGYLSFRILRPFVQKRREKAALQLEEENLKPSKQFRPVTFVSLAFEAVAVVFAAYFAYFLATNRPDIITGTIETVMTALSGLAQPLAVLANPIALDAVFYLVVFGFAIIAIWAGYKTISPLVHLLEAVFAAVGRKLGFVKKIEADAAEETDDSLRFDTGTVRGLTGLYVRHLKLLAGNPIGNILTIVVILGAGALIFTTFASNPTGVEFFVDEEPDQAVVMVSARGNMSAAESLEIVKKVETEVLQTAGIQNVITNAFPPGGGSGPQFIGGVQDKPADVIGEMSLELAKYCCRRKAVDIFAEIRDRTADIPGIKVETRKIEGGPPTGKDIQLEVKSTDYDTMVEQVAFIRAKLDEMEHLLDQEDGRPLPGIEWQITIDREQAGRYQAGIASVGNMVQLVTNGVLIGKYRPTDSEDEVDIRVRLPAKERTLDRFDQLRLQTTLGLVPIANFIDRAPEQKVSSITRRDGLYSMMLKATVDKAAVDAEGKPITVDAKVQELTAWLDTQTFPDNVFLQFRGADEDQKESGEFLMKAMVASLFLMFLILLTQFNSFYQTFLTLSTVVMSVMGVLLGMLLTGQKFSIIMTGTGVVALAGIVVNNAIVLIDTYNRFRHDGFEPLDAILKTSSQRLRPILLTTVTTIVGLIPMATAVNFDFFTKTIAVGGITAIWWIQLSTAVISGLAFSTVLTLVMIPVMIALPSTWVRTFWSVVDWFRSLGSVFKRTPAKTAEDADLEGETIEPANEDVEDLPEEEKRPAAKVVSMPKPAPPKIPPQEELPHAAE
ncbi:efflux RND transporter permease subunit [Labrenzia sp. PHM005]|uniref:efflux RND transporter permease subunit n=1 Tax=Labrenzia sp. PHM005 TaxID=2590016 RepID=UPI00114045D7|nr:efflux RND transporter permease subunit [Labrenzia sp. PHM005]QDG78074.1 efflux RND transporter permease subunit [Labrenzia sp. PHM005]